MMQAHKRRGRGPSLHRMQGSRGNLWVWLILGRVLVESGKRVRRRLTLFCVKPLDEWDDHGHSRRG
jgi:hypothetical protein